MIKMIQILALVTLVSLLSACGIDTSSSTTSAPASQTLTATDSINLAWTPPSTRTDGSYLPLSDLAGYRVYMGTSSNNLSPLVDLNDDTVTQYTVTDIPAGSYYFAVSAYDSEGLESGYSQIILVNFS